MKQIVAGGAVLATAAALVTLAGCGGARGNANAIPNTEVPADWSAGAKDRTRPLCAYPRATRYQGTGDINDAASFRCN